MSIANMQGVTKNINDMADQLKTLYEQSQNGHVINSEDIANIEKLNREIQDLVQNSRDAKEQLAGTVSDLGRNFSSVIESMQAIRNNNPSADIANQLEEASSKINQFISVFQQLGQTKLEINADNIRDITKMTEDARRAIEEMQDTMSKGGNANFFEPVLNNLRAISDTFKDGNVSNQINAAADAVGNLNKVFGDQGQVMQSSSMSIKALGDQMSELSKLTNTMNSGLSDMFTQITGPGTNVTPFTTINEQIQQITNSLGALKGQITSQETWNKPENLGDQTQRIEAALKQVLSQQEQAFNQALGNVSSRDLENTLKSYNDFRDKLIKNVTAMQSILSDPNQLPPVPAGATEQDINEIKVARETAQTYLKNVYDELSKTKFSGIENVYGQSVNLDFNNIMGHGGSERNDMLMRMATGQSLGNNFDYSVGRIGSQAANIYNKALVLDSAAHDPNSGMNSYQRHAVDYSGVAGQAQQLARMQQEYSSVKDQFSGAYAGALKETDPGKRDQAMEKAKERYEYMVKMQNKIKDHAINMGKAFKVSSPEDKERLGKETAELYDYIRSVIKETASSGDSLFSMGKTLEVKPEVLAGLREGTNGIKDMKSAMDEAEKQSKSLWSSMKSGLHEMMSPLHMLSRGLGILGVGSLGGGPLAMLTKSLQYHSEQGRDIYESQRTGLQYGLDANYGLGNTYARLHQGAALHQQSGGRIGIQELNKAYDSAMGSVGGRYGVSAEQGASEMNSLVNNTFLMQKMYGIDQGTMNEAYKTFYKDMGQSADEAANSIAKLTQTAAAANIPASQYLKMVSGIAQQFMKIGLNGKDAENMMGNFIHQGMRAEVAQSMASQTGAAMGNFAQNKNMVGYSAAMMGMDPFEGMASAAYSHDADGRERAGWGKEVAQMMDKMTSQMDLVTGGDPRLRRIVLTDHFKNMGYDQRGASTLTSAFMSGNHEVFQKALEEQNKRMDNPNASLEEVNNKLSGQLDKIAGNLSEQDKLASEINRNLYELAFKTGPSIDQALRELHDAIMKFVGSIGKISESIANGLANFSKSGLFQHVVKPGLELAAEHPIEATLGTYAAWKFARGKWSLPKFGGPGGPTGGSGGPSNILKALSKNPKTAAFALGAGLVAYNSIGSAHSREGDVAERTYDKLHAIHQTMLNGEMNLSSLSSGGPGGFAAHQGSASSTQDYGGSELSAGSGLAMVGGMALAGRANGFLERFSGTAKYADDYATFGKMAIQGEEGAAGLAIKSGAKLMRNAFAKNAMTGLITEGAFGAYDLYDHSQRGDYMGGADIARVGANAGVNLGYMATGAAIGSVVPGVGTVAGGIVGGLAGLAVDTFGEKDANGKGFNDHAKGMLYSLATGGDTLDDLENRRGGLNEGEKIKAKLQMLGYSDKEAEEMSKNLIDNKDELEKHGISLKNMTDEQKTFMALHAKEIGFNKDALKSNSDQGKKICQDMKDLSSAIRNTAFGDKVNKGVQNKVDANTAKVEHELDDKTVLSGLFNKKTSDLSAWKEKLVNELRDNPEDSSKVNEIADVDEKLKKLERAKYLTEGGEDQRRLDHGDSWDKLNIFERGGQSRDEFINNQISQDWKAANEMRDLYGGEYVNQRVSEGALNEQQAADQVENSVTNPGSTDDDRKDQKADDSRRQAANSTAEKVVKQNQKQEELNKEGNKLSHTLIDQEKVLFKALEASGNNNTKQLHTKLEEIRRLLDRIQFNTANGGRGGGSAGGYNITKDSGITGAKLNENLKGNLSGMGDYIAKQARASGLDPAAVAAVMRWESSNGTSKAAMELNNFGGIMGANGLKSFSSKEEGIDAVIRTLVGFVKEGKVSLAQIQKEYAPEGAANDPTGLNSNWLKGVTDMLREEGIQVGGGNGSGPFGVDLQKHRGSNGCTAVAAEALSGNSVVDNLASKSMWVPTWMEMSKKNGTWRDTNNYNPQVGDLAITNGDGHVVVYAGDGKFVGNSSSKEHAVYDDISTLGDVTGYIATGYNGGAGGGSYTPSEGSSYEASNNIEAATYNLNSAATNGQAPSSSQANAKAAASSSSPGTLSTNVIGEAKAAMKSKTGKAFYDGTMIEHHLGGVGIWYGNNSGSTLNWGTMQAAMHEAGGAGTDIGGHRKWMEESRKARINSDLAMGVNVQNPVAARSLSAIVPPINSEIAKDMAKNIEALNIPTTVTNSNILKAATDKTLGDQENSGKEISVNITIDKAVDNFVDGFGAALKEAVSKLGARVENIEERSVKTAQTARTALHTGISQRIQSQVEQYGGR